MTPAVFVWTVGDAIGVGWLGFLAVLALVVGLLHVAASLQERWRRWRAK